MFNSGVPDGGVAVWLPAPPLTLSPDVTVALHEPPPPPPFSWGGVEGGVWVTAPTPHPALPRQYNEGHWFYFILSRVF